jgi:hypothetical protein
VVITRVSPSCSASSALVDAGVDARAPLTPVVGVEVIATDPGREQVTDLPVGVLAFG